MTGPTGSARRPRGSPPSPEQTPPMSMGPRRTVTEISCLKKASSSVMADQVRITPASPSDAVPAHKNEGARSDQGTITA